MTLALVLKVHDPKLPMRVKSNAAGAVVRAVLEQQHKDVWRPVEYFSKRLNNTGSRYRATKHEMLGYIMAIEHWHLYSIGRAFNILTDYALN